MGELIAGSGNSMVAPVAKPGGMGLEFHSKHPSTKIQLQLPLNTSPKLCGMVLICSHQNAKSEQPRQRHRQITCTL